MFLIKLITVQGALGTQNRIKKWTRKNEATSKHIHWLNLLSKVTVLYVISII